LTLKGASIAKIIEVTSGAFSYINPRKPRRSIQVNCSTYIFLEYLMSAKVAQLKSGIFKNYSDFPLSAQTGL